MPDEEWLANLLHAFGYKLDSEFCGHIEECSLSFVWALQLPTHRLVWNVAPNHGGNRRTLEQDANELGMGLRISVLVSDPPIDVHRQAAAVVVQIRSDRCDNANYGRRVGRRRWQLTRSHAQTFVWPRQLLHVRMEEGQGAD